MTRAVAVLLALGRRPPRRRRRRRRSIELAYTQFTLPNGLHVILHEDHSVPIVTVNMWYHVGSAREQPGRTGFAHLFEHLMFMGSGHVEAGRVRHVARSGGRQQQRLDRERSHQLLHQRAVERARARAVPRVGSHGLSARLDDAEDRRRAARRREERAAPELREPSVRHGASVALGEMLYPGGPSVSLAGDRLHGGSDRRELRRRGGVLQEVLRAGEREPGRRRRHRRRRRARRSSRSGSAT